MDHDTVPSSLPGIYPPVMWSLVAGSTWLKPMAPAPVSAAPRSNLYSGAVDSRSTPLVRSSLPSSKPSLPTTATTLSSWNATTTTTTSTPWNATTTTTSSSTPTVYTSPSLTMTFPTCNCNLPAKQFITKKPGPNEGRAFFKCGNPNPDQVYLHAWLSDLSRDATTSNGSMAPIRQQPTLPATPLQLNLWTIITISPTLSASTARRRDIMLPNVQRGCNKRLPPPIRLILLMVLLLVVTPWERRLLGGVVIANR